MTKKQMLIALLAFVPLTGYSQFWSRSAPNTFLTNPGDYVGIGRSTPWSTGNKFEVEAGGVMFQSTQGGRVRFENPNLEEGFSIHTASNNARADIRLNTSGLKIGCHAVTGPVPTSNLMHITPAGNFGIGTSSPGAKFEIDAGITPGGSGLKFTRLTGGLGSNQVLTVNAAGDVVLTADQNTIYTGGSGITINGSNVINSTWTQSGSDITNNNAGNVGIGVATPSARLHVNGTGTFSGDLTGQNKLMLPNLSTSPVAPGDNILYIKSNGEVYKNTSPNSWSITGNNTSGSVLTLGTLSSTDINIISDGTNVGKIFYADKNFEYGYATTFGRLGVPYSSDYSTRIHSIKTPSQPNYLTHRILSVFDGSFTPVEMFAVTPGSTVISTGQTLVGGFADFTSYGGGTGLLAIGGNIEPATDITYDLGGSLYRWNEVYGRNSMINTSDIRHKKNILDLEYGIKSVMEMRPVTYEWKEKGNGTRLGFIAQEMEIIVPEVVHKDSLGNYGMRYTEIIPILTKAIQEQQVQIDAQQAQIEELKELVAANNGTGISGTKTSQGLLNQNVPNPFTQNTTIGYTLPQNAKTAAIGVYDLNGREVKLFQLGAETTGSVVIDGGSMQAGMYVYSLLINGMPIDTKKMVLTSH